MLNQVSTEHVGGITCRKGRLHCTGFLTVFSKKDAQYSLPLLISQVLYGQFQVMKSRLQIYIFEMCMLLSIYLKFYTDWIGKHFQMLTMLHKFNEVHMYISIIVNCYEYEQIQSFFAHCA